MTQGAKRPLKKMAASKLCFSQSKSGHLCVKKEEVWECTDLEAASLWCYNVGCTLRIEFEFYKISNKPAN